MASMTKRAIIRTKGREWCRLEVELKDGRLSICGSAGEITTSRQAKRDALQYWTDFFEESPEERHAMNDRLGRNFRTAKSAARFVLDSDGEYHGLDVDHEQDDKVFTVHSCGQIREELSTWFPEAAPYLKYHLNDMHSECEHQEARGETYATHPSAECPDCGYRLGSAWTKRELPAAVIAWAEGLNSEVSK